MTLEHDKMSQICTWPNSRNYCTAILTLRREENAVINIEALVTDAMSKIRKNDLVWTAKMLTPSTIKTDPKKHYRVTPRSTLN